MYQKPFITKLHLVNFRSIRDAVIEFDNPLFLVGHNGTGKSNILDAFTFLADCIQYPVQNIWSPRRRAFNLPITANFEEFINQFNGLRPNDLAMRVDFAYNQGDEIFSGHYAFSLGRVDRINPLVHREQCLVTSSTGVTDWFDRHNNLFRTSVVGIDPAIENDALVLPIVGGIKHFSTIVKKLAAMRIYKIDPNQMHQAADLYGDQILSRTASNIAAILFNIEKNDHAKFSRIVALLQSSTPGNIDIHFQGSEPDEFYPQNRVDPIMPLFTQRNKDNTSTTLPTTQISYGTLMILGMIVAAYQNETPSLIALEEPETGLHPGALSLIAEIIEFAASRTQVVITSHSPDLLDAKWIRPENVRVVNWDEGETSISRLGVAPIKMLQEHLMGAGELMRANALDEQEGMGGVAEPLFDEIAV